MSYLKYCALGLLTLVGCATPTVTYDRDWLSPAFATQTGYEIRPESATTDWSIPAGVDLDDGVDEDEAVAIALWNNPDFNIAIAQLGVRRADLVQAGLLANPVLSLLFPVGAKQLEFWLLFPVESLFLRDKRIAVAESECERVGAQLVQNGLDLVEAVRVAYADLALARRTAAIASPEVQVNERRAEFFAARYRNGAASEIEVDDARISALESAANAASLVAAVRLAEGRLRDLLGPAPDETELRFVEDPGERIPPAELETAGDLAVAPAATPIEQAGLDLLIELAMAYRPDLRGAELVVEAAAKRAGLADSDWWRASFVIDANGSGENGFEIGPGLLLEIPIFSQGQGQQALAAAELQLAFQRYAATRHRVATEVVDAHTRLAQAREQLVYMQSEVLPAIVAAEGRAQRAEELGATSILAVLAFEERRVGPPASVSV